MEESISIVKPKELERLVDGCVRSALQEVLPEIIRESREKPYLSSKELQELTGLSARSIAYKKSRGEIPFVQHGRKVLYPRAAIIKWLESGRVLVKE